MLNTKKAKIRELMAANVEWGTSTRLMPVFCDIITNSKHTEKKYKELEDALKLVKTEAERREAVPIVINDEGIAADLTSNVAGESSSRKESEQPSRASSPASKRRRVDLEEESSTPQATPSKAGPSAAASSRVAHSSDSDELGPPDLFGGPSALSTKPALAARRYALRPLVMDVNTWS